jgi:tetratricopeptide (TPR) repeat protein
MGLTAVAAPEPDAPTETPAPYQAPTDPSELLKVDEPMRRFFGERLRGHRRSEDRLHALLKAIFQPDGLNFTYDFERTLDARETFRQRRGNCVSFSFLFVAVAREFGLEASFQNAVTPLKWDRYGSIVVSVRHMNVGVEIGPDVHLVDLQPDEIAGMALTDMPAVEDRRAFAQFYDNVGFFELLHGRRAEALHYMIVATTTDPTSAGAWANRAAMRAHFNNLAEARADYERALQLDPRDLFTLEGYVGILQRLGSADALRIAAKYERRAQAVRDRNPYYQQRLAERAQERGDWVAAEKLYRRAIALKDTEPQFYEQWITALTQLGKADAARRAAGKLEKLRRRLAEAPVHFTP